MPRLNYLHTEAMLKDHVHGYHDKFMLVVHETVTKDMVGLADIKSVELSLAQRDYGIHDMSDEEGYMAHAYGLGRAIFWQAGGVNPQSAGIEQISYIPALIQADILTNDQAYKLWLSRERQLNATALLISAWHNSAPKDRPIRYCDGSGDHEGVTSHWNVSQFHKESAGHWDCRPHDQGGHYPLGNVIHRALMLAPLGFTY